MIFNGRAIAAAALLALAASAPAGAALISNPWSSVAGDRAAYCAFAFRATAGDFPNNVNPSDAFDGVQMFTLDSLTLTRPANDTASNVPPLGTGKGQLSSLAAPVYIDVYAGRSSYLVYTNYLGSSTNAVVFNDGVDLISPGESFTFSFSGIALDKDATYWMVFSEDGVDGEVSAFRTRVNTSGSDAVAGSGKGYLVANTVQLDAATGAQDWGVEFDAQVTVPEPTGLALSVLAAFGLLARRRGPLAC